MDVYRWSSLFDSVENAQDAEARPISKISTDLFEKILTCFVYYLITYKYFVKTSYKAKVDQILTGFILILKKGGWLLQFGVRMAQQSFYWINWLVIICY